MKFSLVAVILWSLCLILFPSINETIVEASGPFVFEGESIDASESGSEEASALIQKAYKFANIFAAVVLSISILGIILVGLQFALNGLALDGRMSYGMNLAKYRLLACGGGIVIAISAFGLGRLFAQFAI